MVGVRIAVTSLEFPGVRVATLKFAGVGVEVKLSNPIPYLNWKFKREATSRVDELCEESTEREGNDCTASKNKCA